eukprot:scaffold158865_cov55-Attheya_sp.AAC.1
MNVPSAEEVLNLPLNAKEKHHHSREHMGFHVFLSRFFFEFKTLTDEAQQECVAHLFPQNDGDSDLVDSVDTDMPINHIAVMRLACSRWRNLSGNL